MIRDISIFDIEVDQIEPHPQNPRKDLGDLTELCESIKANGIMQNLTVVPLDDQYTRFRCVIGHRRLAAAKKVGMEKVPATIVPDMDEREQIAVMVAENMQRADLTIPEQVGAVQLMLDLGEDFGSIADRTGLSESTVRRRAKLAAYDQGALEKAYKRGASLFDLEKIEKIEDPELQAKCLAAAGTDRFAKELDNARRKIEQRKETERAVEIAEKMGGTKTESGSGMYYGAFLSAYVIKTYLNNDQEIEDYKRKNFPEDAKIFYIVNYGSVSLYFTSEKKDIERREKNKEREEEREREKRIDGVRERIHERIRAFIVDLIRQRAALSEEAQTEAEDIFREEFFDKFDVEQQMNRFINEDQIDKDLFNEFRSISLFAVWYMLMYDNMLIKEIDGEWDMTEDADRMYRVLESLGYQTSEEEELFLAAQHECFKPVVFEEDDDE